MEEGNVYAAVGEAGFERLVAAFYRQVPADDVLGPLYPADDLPGAEQRLREFLIFRFGGPPRYIEQRGHPRLRIRHAPFAIGDAARARWLQLMEQALAEATLPDEAAQVLRTFFASTAAFLMNRPGWKTVTLKVDSLNWKKRWVPLADVHLNDGESLESALKRFKRKVLQEEIIKDIKSHAFYLKPGQKKRVKSALARKRNRKKRTRDSEPDQNRS
jgi:hemoglobin